MALRKKNKHKLIGAHMRTDHFSITICLFSERDSSSASLRGSCSWPKGTSGSQSHIRSFVTLETEKLCLSQQELGLTSIKNSTALDSSIGMAFEHGGLLSNAQFKNHSELSECILTVITV